MKDMLKSTHQFPITMRFVVVGWKDLEAMEIFPRRAPIKISQHWFGRILAGVITERRKGVMVKDSGT